MSVNPGIWVRQAIASAPKSYGKYANVALEKWTFQEMWDEWCRITGKKGEYVPCTPEQWTNLWGPPGTEVSPQQTQAATLGTATDMNIARAAVPVRRDAGSVGGGRLVHQP